MVTADVSRSVDGVQRAFENMNLKVLAPVAVLGAGGIFLAQETIDLVLPRLGLNPDPRDATSPPKALGAAALIKIVVALALVAVGVRTGSRAIAGATTVLAFGVIAHAGADVVDMAQRGGLPGNAPAMGASPSPSRKPKRAPAPRRASPSTSQQVSVSAGSSGGSSSGSGKVDAWS